MKLKHRLSGFEEADKVFKQLPLVVSDRVLRDATLSGARVWRQAIKANAPTHTGEQSPMSKQYGTIRRNLRAFSLRRLKRAQKGARVDTGDAFWGWFLERGTRHIAAKPWFLPAAKAALDAVLNKMSQRISERLPKEAEKLANRQRGKK